MKSDAPCTAATSTGAVTYLARVVLDGEDGRVGPGRLAEVLVLGEVGVQLVHVRLVSALSRITKHITMQITTQTTTQVTTRIT